MTTPLTFDGKPYEVREGETVLEALLRQSAGVRFSCRAGTCHACLQRAVEGVPPSASQTGLDPALAAQGYFLACKCKPAGPLACEPVPPEARAAAVRAAKAGRQPLTGERRRELVDVLVGQGLMRKTLEDFYTRVFTDEVLAPYFRGVTQDRLVGKVYAFLHDHFAGTKQFFGAQPRNSHHWMVIPDDVFDYREALMRRTLADNGVPAWVAAEWLAYEETFRGDIVKTVAFPLVLEGVEMPLDGFGEEVLTAGSLCDGCGREIDAGETVRYHLRLGSVYCLGCALPQGPAK